MIIITAKRPRFHFATGITCLTTACAFFLVLGLVHQPYEQAISTPTIVESKVKNEKQRLEYLAQWGWTVEETPLATQTLRIPFQLDESYQGYMDLQSTQGFPSLEEYCGLDVTQYTYEITNYPTGQQGVQVNLLCYDSKVIAGEVLSSEINGFIHGLAIPR